MIPAGVEIFVGTAPIDLRWGFDRLAGLVESELGRGPRSGALFVFFGKRRSAIKVIFFDGSGLCVFYKRLDAGVFRLAELDTPSDRCVEIPAHVFDELLDGIAVEPKPAGKRSPRMRIH